MSMLENIKASLFAYCKTFAATMQTQGVAQLSLYNFDAYAENNTLPDGDLIGPYRTSVDSNSRLISVKTMFGIVTETDENLFRLDALAGQLFDQLQPGEYVPLLQSVGGAQIGRLIAAGDVSVSPALRAQKRPLKLLHVTLLSDLASA